MPNTKKNKTEKAVVIQTDYTSLTVETMNTKQTEAYNLAKTMLEDNNRLVDSYRFFCGYVRKHLIPKETNQILKLAGFRPDQCSRIKAVVSLPDELYRPYEHRQISFNAALDKAVEAKAQSKGKKRKGAKKSVVFNVQKAASKVIAKEPTLTRCFLVGRQSVVCIMPLETKEHVFEVDGVRVTCLVQPKNK
jgi:hypothetical protein